MKRVYEPDPILLRIAEYEKMDSELMHAMVETIEALGKAGATLPDSMVEILERRQAVKAKFKKSPV